MLGFMAAALLASTQSPATASPATETPAPPTAPADSASSDVLESASPWWERITVVVDDKGAQRSCRYETSVKGSESCGEAMSASVGSGVKGRSGQFSKVTFERRFSPDGKLDAGKLQPGDMLLGRQVMFLTIDARGAISSCKVVATAGDTPPDYGCAEAKKEQFRVQASAAPAARQAFMTVLAYGHTELIA